MPDAHGVTLGAVDRRRICGMVRRAWVRGDIKRRPCEWCGTESHLVAHHEDYSKPLEVTWLCKAHHFQRHAQIRNALKRRA